MLKQALLFVLAVLVIFEEWLWDVLTAAGKWLAAALHLERLDERLARSSPGEALVALCIPLLIVTPINLAAVFLLVHGGVWQGLLLEVVAKLLGTLLVARVFRLVRPALLSFSWFSWLYHGITGILRWAHDLVRETALYRLSRALKRAAGYRLGQIMTALRRAWAL